MRLVAIISFWPSKILFAPSASNRLSYSNKLKLKMVMSISLHWFNSGVKWSNLISGSNVYTSLNPKKKLSKQFLLNPNYYIFSFKALLLRAMDCPFSRHANTLLIGYLRWICKIFFSECFMCMFTRIYLNRKFSFKNRKYRPYYSSLDAKK